MLLLLLDCSLPGKGGAWRGLPYPTAGSIQSLPRCFQRKRKVFPQEALCCRYLKCTAALKQLDVMRSLSVVFLAAEEREVNADTALQRFQLSSLSLLYFFCPNTLFPCFSCNCSKEATGGWWCRPMTFLLLYTHSCSVLAFPSRFQTFLWLKWVCGCAACFSISDSNFSLLGSLG